MCNSREQKTTIVFATSAQRRIDVVETHVVKYNILTQSQHRINVRCLLGSCDFWDGATMGKKLPKQILHYTCNNNTYY